MSANPNLVDRPGDLDLLTPRQAAEYLRVKVRTLQSWRHNKQGPQFLRLPTGHVRYERGALRRWAYTGGEQ